jgi:Domain of unknown function (DUF5753)
MITFPKMSDQERRRFVDFRLERQAVVNRTHGRVPLSCVLDEVVLLRSFVDQRVHDRQLLALHDQLTYRPEGLDVRILPLRGAPPQAVGGPFVIFRFDQPGDQDIVHFEGREGAVYLENAADVERYAEIFTVLRNASLSRSASLARLQELASSLSR